MNELRQENRFKILAVDPRLLIDLVNWQRNPTSKFHLVVPTCDKLPDDVEVIAVNTNWSTRAVELLLYHSSFDEVPFGCEVPKVIDVDFSCRIHTLEPETTDG